jgi:predicted nucleic acid-binding protein
MSYWDTSTLVKLYVKEADSAALVNHLRSAAGAQATSRIALYEARATFRRKESDGLLPAGATQILHAQLLQDVSTGIMRLIEIGTDLEREYGQILDFCHSRSPLIAVRTLDAIHLASAKLAVESEIVTTDKRMRDAAKQLGFAVFPV